jgi:hypothetical protein
MLQIENFRKYPNVLSLLIQQTGHKVHGLIFSTVFQCFPGFIRKGFDHAKCFYLNGTATWYVFGSYF